MIDTADVILHRATGERYTVACVHGDWLHTNGHPERRLRIDSCDHLLVATDEQRRETLERLASSSATTHRPACARARIAAELGLVGDADG